MAAIEIGQIVQDFTIITVISSVMALISYKLKQPMVIGYIIAGMIIGPYTPPFSLLINLDILNLFAEIGIILLLFVVGMEFPIEKLRSIGRRALVIALSEAIGTFVSGIVIAQQFLHYSLYNSLFLGLAISVTSTVIVMRILEELDMIKEEASQLILGVAVIEDIVVISMLAILQSVSSTGHLSIIELGLSIGTVLAFIAGVIIAESKVHSVTRVIVTPIRDMFAAIFFVSVGALMDIRLLVIFIVLALVLIVISIAAKFLTVFLSSRTQGISLRTSIRTAFGLSSSGGELAQVVAKGGVDVGVSSSFILPMVGSMTIITTFITPYMVKIGWKIADALDISDNNRSNNNKKT
jgi:monovalent cation:H+ antiporter-2, CPA2 family